MIGKEILEEREKRKATDDKKREVKEKVEQTEKQMQESDSNVEKFIIMKRIVDTYSNSRKEEFEESLRGLKEKVEEDK